MSNYSFKEGKKHQKKKEKLCNIICRPATKKNIHKIEMNKESMNGKFLPSCTMNLDSLDSSAASRFRKSHQENKLKICRLHHSLHVLLALGNVNLK